MGLLKGILRGVAALMALAVLLGVLAVLTLYVANRSDEPLRPEVEALKTAPLPQIAGEENAWHALVGLAAPAGADPREWGGKWIASARTVTDEPGLQTHKTRYSTHYSTNAAASRRPLCRPGRHACLEEALAKRTEIEARLVKDAELLARYELASKLAAYEESFIGNPWTPLPPYAVWNEAQSLLFARIAFMAADGDVPGALALLERDAALSRRVLAGSRNLLSKMVGARALANDLLVASEMARRYRNPMREHAPRLQALAASLTPEERALKPALEGEVRMMANLYAQMRQQPVDLPGILPGAFGGLDSIKGLALQYAFQPNATSNRYYAMIEPMLAVDKLGGGAIEAAQNKANEVIAGVEGNSPVNPVGRHILGLASSRQDVFAYRLYDLEGITRLVRVQAKLLQSNPPADTIPDMLKSLGAELGDPYTGRPMAWESEGGRLSFKARSPWGTSQDETGVGDKAGRIVVMP